MTNTSGDAAIVKAAIGLAQTLNLRVVVEGVETEEQLRLVKAWGCQEVQGYYYSKPIPAEAATALLRIGMIAPLPHTDTIIAVNA